MTMRGVGRVRPAVAVLIGVLAAGTAAAQEAAPVEGVLRCFQQGRELAPVAPVYRIWAAGEVSPIVPPVSGSGCVWQPVAPAGGMPPVAPAPIAGAAAAGAVVPSTVRPEEGRPMPALRLDLGAPLAPVPPGAAIVPPDPPARIPPPSVPAAALPGRPGPFVVEAGGRHWAQLAAFRSEAEAASEWESQSARFPDLLTSLSPVVVRADLGPRGVYYRLRVGPFTRPTAEAFCARHGDPCIVFGFR